MNPLREIRKLKARIRELKAKLADLDFRTVNITRRKAAVRTPKAQEDGDSVFIRPGSPAALGVSGRIELNDSEDVPVLIVEERRILVPSDVDLVFLDPED